MPGIGFSTEAVVKGAFFSQWKGVLADMFEDSLEEAVKVGAGLVQDRAPYDTGEFHDSIIGEVRTSRHGNRYGQVRSDVDEPRRRWLERGERGGVKMWRGHKMFFRGRAALRKRERTFAQNGVSRNIGRIR